MKKHILWYFFLFSLCENVYASVYASLEDARKGLSLGRSVDESYRFAESIGQIRFLRKHPDKDGNIKFSGNGTLIAPDTILTVAHAFNDECRAAAIIFYPDAEIVANATHKAKSMGVKPEDIYLEDGSGLKVSDVTASLNLDTIQKHPTYDVAIVKLKTPMTRIPVLPLHLDRTLEYISPGYLVSTNNIYISGDSHLFSVSKRHVSIIDFFESSLIKEDGRNCVFLTKEWEVDGDISDPYNKSCKFKATDPSLLAYNYAGDSGAPLITKEGCIIGVLKGSYNYSNTDCNTAIIPLSYIREWILSFMG